MTLTIDFVRRAVAPVLSAHGIDRAFVFGSVARGEAGEGSDVDIRVERTERFEIAEFLALKGELEGACGVPMDLVTSPKERLNPVFARLMGRDEVVVYGEPGPGQSRIPRNNGPGYGRDQILAMRIISDIREVFDRIEACGITHDSFVASEGIQGRMERDTIAMPLRAIAEEAALLSEGVREEMPGAPLSEVTAFLAGDFHDLTDRAEEIWYMVHWALPALSEGLRAYGDARGWTVD